MTEFKMSRNGSGYYDETAYKGINEMAKPGEVWSYLTNNGFRKNVLIIKNHGTFCTALALVDEDSPESIKVCDVDGYPKYTDVRLIQYVYNSNFSRLIAVVSSKDFDEILNDIATALDISKKPEEKSPIYYSCFNEMIALFGKEAVENYCRCSYLYFTLNGDIQTANLFMEELKRYRGGYR